MGARVRDGLSEDEIAALDSFARCMGLAFQVVDDILDVTQDSSVLGKTAGKDADAKDALDRLISGYPQSLLAPDASLRLAQAYAADVQGPSYDQGATKQAITYYAREAARLLSA